MTGDGNSPLMWRELASTEGNATMTTVNAEIVAIGSELLLGQIVDTNSAWMAQRLAEIGVNLFYKTIVGDNAGRMREIIRRALERSDVVITSGGIGPTEDDLTREIVAEVAGRELVLDPSLLEQIEERFRKRGFIMTKNNEKQAYIPAGCMPVENPNGTAPSFIVEDAQGVIICLPGVPFEMKWLFDHRIIPYLRQKFDLREMIISRVLKIAEIGESSVDDRIGHLIRQSTNPTVGVLAHPGQVDVRISVKTDSVDKAQELIAPVEQEVRAAFTHHVFAIDQETMEDVIGRLLKTKGVSIAVIEDLTGGMIAQRLQQAARESLAEAMIAHTEEPLRRVLRHSHHPERVDELLQDDAALTAELAYGIRTHSQADLGLAVRAIPDPTRATQNLSPGTTYIAVADAKGLHTREYNFAGRGTADLTRMTMYALNLVRRTLEGTA
jgi:nicotinamide-nucleotide amidase